MRAYLAVLILAIAVPTTGGAQQSLKVHMHADDGYAADGLFFKPAGSGPFAALVLVPDEWGLASAVIDQAKHFAASGYLVVAVDLYRGEVAGDAQKAAQLAGGLPSERALHDLKAAVAFLTLQGNLRPDHIGAVGWSSGGVYALRLANEVPGVRAVVMNECGPPADTAQLTGLKAAVLGNFAGRDPAAAAPAVRGFQQQLRARGIDPDIKIYPDAAHDFERPDLPGFRADDARDAEARTDKFLALALNR